MLADGTVSISDLPGSRTTKLRLSVALCMRPSVTVSVQVCLPLGGLSSVTDSPSPSGPSNESVQASLSGSSPVPLPVALSGAVVLNGELVLSPCFNSVIVALSTTPAVIVIEIVAQPRSETCSGSRAHRLIMCVPAAKLLTLMRAPLPSIPPGLLSQLRPTRIGPDSGSEQLPDMLTSVPSTKLAPSPGALIVHTGFSFVVLPE